jgi:hypothetical protein
MSKPDPREIVESWTVHFPGGWENNDGPQGWWAVSSDDAGGIVAYFQDEIAAERFRLSEVNRALEGFGYGIRVRVD